MPKRLEEGRTAHALTLLNLDSQNRPSSPAELSEEAAWNTSRLLKAMTGMTPEEAEQYYDHYVGKHRRK